jgi:2,4-dienoyl-CoA reductase-like NADH-dependent reductase (Old Yellow Enzyme family)
LEADSDLSRLFEPVSLGAVTVRNRIVMLPHTTFYTQAGRPSDRHHHYYLERARGGVGLVIVESMNVHESGHVGGTIDAFDAEAMAPWRRTIDAVHGEGAKMFGQLTHFGLEASPADSLKPLWSPSAIPSPVTREIPKAMTLSDIAEVKAGFAASAANAREAGFDGVELKVGHDGMLRTFLSPFSNHREDQYGGTPENRVRFVVETIAAVRAAIGPDTALGVRISLDEGFPGGYGLDEGIEYARLIAASGQLDYMTSDLGTWAGFTLFAAPTSIKPGYADKATAAMKAVTGLPVIAFGRIKRPEHAAQIVAEGTADLIGMTRQLLTDPEWARKVADGRLDEIRPCVACNQECIGRALRSLPISCVHNPGAGREGTLGVLTRRVAAQPKRVLVVGGGPAGLKAAESAALAGHEVVLVERAPRLGGQVALAARAPGHDEWGEIVSHLESRVRALGVEVRLGVEATSTSLAADHADAVILATGAGPGPWPFGADPAATVLDEWQVIEGDAPRSTRVVMVDLGVRFEPAAVLETLLHRDNEVYWIAPTPTVGVEIEPGSLIALMARLADAKLHRMPTTMPIAAGADDVTVIDVLTGRTLQIADVGAVVVVGNKVSNNSLTIELEGSRTNVQSVGDCVAPRHTAISIYEGEVAGRAI